MDGLRKFQVPKYLRKIISSYLRDREIIYETAQGIRLRRVTVGAVQGSVLGLVLWNIMYDQVLSLILFLAQSHKLFLDREGSC